MPRGTELLCRVGRGAASNEIGGWKEFDEREPSDQRERLL